MRILRILLLLAALMPITSLFAQAATNATAQPKAASIPANRSEGVDSHKLRAGDVIEVQVYGEDELKVKQPIDSNGHFSLRLIGKVKLEGLTAEEAAKQIRDLYMVDYLVNPLVSVNILEFAKFRFTIAGQVKNPGNYTYEPSERLNIIQALAKAGGVTRIGDEDKIDIIRVVDGKEKVIRVNTSSKQREGSKLFEIQPGDLIKVGETRF